MQKNHYGCVKYHNFTRIPNRLLHLALQGTLKTLRGLRWFFVSIGTLINVIIVIPLKSISGTFFRFLLVPSYRGYRKGKQIVRNLIKPIKDSLLNPFVSKHIVTIVFVAIAVVIVINNIGLRDARAEAIGKNSIIASVEGGPDTDIEETVVGIAPKNNNIFMALVTPVQASEVPVVQDQESSVRSLEVVTTLSTTADSQKQNTDVVSYVVKGGDTVSTIAQAFGISTQTVLWANGLGDLDYIKPGQTLQIPPVSGVVHKVAGGDTVGSIARKYNVSEDSILQYNHLADASLITKDQTLIIPGGAPPAPPAPVRSRSSQLADVPSSYQTPPPSAGRVSNMFRWPTSSHKINQYFKGYRHTGVDIDGDYSSPIYAAADGQVESVVYQRYGYGYHVIIRHGGGYTTLYGHASKIFVKPGQHVNQGQTIAMVGSTGRSTGTHLHFEIIVSGGKSNPLGYIR